MTKVIHTRKARSDLLSIWSYIAEDNPDAADKLLDAIDKKCALLGENPRLGQARADIAPAMRHFPVKNYLILYQERPSGIEVVRVIHGSRDLNEISPGSD
ncbi:MAG: type II toxin-antitoxin system RelE/ParE family toxin [Methylococcaceae bacterium]|nr:MAG: type II toxin-antitoxin system RelE/ParE family toxin [Methylococcaceae bacterium]